MARTGYIAACILLGLRAVASLPTGNEEYPDFTPGPGLPSLAELGLTLADLYSTNLDYNTTDISPRAAEFTGVCGPDPGYVQVAGVVACYKFLMALGSYPLSVTSGALPKQIAAAQGAAITVQGLADTSSTAANAAGGVLWVLNSCTRPDGSIAGSQAATGNGNFIVEVYNQNYE